MRTEGTYIVASALVHSRNRDGTKKSVTFGCIRPETFSDLN